MKKTEKIAELLSTISRQNDLGLPRTVTSYNAVEDVVTIRLPRDEQAWMGKYDVSIKFKGRPFRKFRLIAPNAETAIMVVEDFHCRRFDFDAFPNFVDIPHLPYEHILKTKVVCLREPE